MEHPESMVIPPASAKEAWNCLQIIALATDSDKVILYCMANILVVCISEFRLCLSHPSASRDPPETRAGRRIKEAIDNTLWVSIMVDDMNININVLALYQRRHQK